jgi:cellulose synthase/poly-beta-1,6-N-acetylglucosamine synthase-like glycosyltransferase
VGICATGSSKNLPTLLRLIASESFPDDFVLGRIIIVASGCAAETLNYVRSFVGNNERIFLIEESERRGKADAINKIFENSVGSHIVFVNADALPVKGSILELLLHAQRSESIGMVSGSPSLGQDNNNRNDATSMVEELMWSIHNECSSKLNRMNTSNHVSDEMMVVRTSAIKGLLPYGLVNDGAYIGGIMKLRGYSIKFCSNAKVVIDVPERVTDLIRQRRRVIFGHFQVWRLTGHSPKTVESLLLFSPTISLRIVVKVLAMNPRLVKIVPITLVSEAISFLLALKDTLSKNSSRKHEVWKRYAN